MKIALLGYGKMGKMVETCALAQGYTITAKLSHPSAHDFPLLASVDVCIDFSHPTRVLDHLALCAQLKKNIVIGTTGWDSSLQEAQEIVQQAKIGCLYSPNFSLGVYLFTQMMNYAAQLINPFLEYDVAGIEYHHRKKADIPSGTARALAKQLVQQMPRLDPFAFSSVRCGYEPGTHTIHFDGPFDKISLTHEARNREGFAHGALKAAQWIIGKTGFFTFEDWLNNMSRQADLCH